MTRLGLKSNREGRNREASERKGREKVTKNAKKGLKCNGITKKIFFGITPSYGTRSLHLSSVV